MTNENKPISISSKQDFVKPDFSEDCDEFPLDLLCPIKTPEDYVFDSKMFHNMSLGIVFEGMSEEEIKMAKMGYRRII